MASTIPLTEPPRPGGSGAPGGVTPAEELDSRSSPETVRVRIDLAYDGGPFRGFAENVGVRTVAGDLRGALERVLRCPIELVCAGRTDAGVHARGQVVSFDASPSRLYPSRLRNSLNSMLAPSIAVTDVQIVDQDFSARFSATWRSYRYTVLTGEVPDPFATATAWWVDDRLDVDAMDRAAAALLGEHDFSAFCRRPKDDPDASLVRCVRHVRWDRSAAPFLVFEIVARAFCHQMVRSIVGTLVQVGRGRIAAASIPQILESRDRSLAGNLAPPNGLCLFEVGYGDATPTLLAAP